MADFAAPRKASLHALVVDINEFKNSSLRLNYPVADAGLFADTLARGAKGLFKTVDIRQRVTPAETTSAAILDELASMKSLRPEDLFVFYIASHGTVDDGQYFLITSKVGSLRTERLKTDALPQDLLTAAIANIPATKKLIIIDTCNAGALGEAIQVAVMTRGLSEDTALKILIRAVGSTILSASTSRQEALEGYQGHGLFTYVLAEGLSGKADPGGTGYVKTTALDDYFETLNLGHIDFHNQYSSVFYRFFRPRSAPVYAGVFPSPACVFPAGDKRRRRAADVPGGRVHG